MAQNLPGGRVAYSMADVYRSQCKEDYRVHIRVHHHERVCAPSVSRRERERYVTRGVISRHSYDVLDNEMRTLSPETRPARSCRMATMRRIL